MFRLILNLALGNRFSNCFAQKQKASDRRREEEEDKHRDRISVLSDDILHLILSFLPLKSVGQTSVLSRRWSHVRSSYPIIDFYEIFTGGEAFHHQTKERIINTVLAPRNENYSIKISPIPGDPNRSFSLSRVEHLVLDVSLSRENRSFELPRCQRKCHSLRRLESNSSRCGSSWLGFPSSYVVGSYLRSLHTLSLTCVDSALVMDFFSGSSFVSLEQLKIESCRGTSDLKISCPNLRDVRVFDMDLNSLHISGMRIEFLDVWWCFKKCINGTWVKILAPNLLFITWGYNAITENCSIQSFPRLKRSVMWSRNRGPITKTKINNNGVVDLLSGSSQVEVLTISYNYLQLLSETYFELGGLPFSFMKLETLRIKNPSCRLNKRYIPGIACLFKSSPKVHTLEICFSDSFKGKGKVNDKWNNILLDDSNCTEEQFWETQAQNFSPFLSHLKVANIEVGNNSINFAKFLLKYGSGLQEVILSFRKGRSTLPPNSLNDFIKGIPPSICICQILNFLLFNVLDTLLNFRYYFIKEYIQVNFSANELQLSSTLLPTSVIYTEMRRVPS
ncbi:hypothetical protein ABKV19_010252 [Rosa sericea]